MAPRLFAREPEAHRRGKWFNSPVACFKGTLKDIQPLIPDFERRPFYLSDENRSRLNERLDTIVRKPFNGDPDFIPVGVVSKEYVLVPHVVVLNVATQALDAAKIAPTDVKAELKITEYGERMALSLFLPEKYQFDPCDGHPMALRLECLNSVDGSTRFQALMGWFRFVCSNGLVIGVTRSDVRRRHVGDLDLSDIGAVLKSGLEESETEKKNFETWRKEGIASNKLTSWVDKDLREGWGFKAAARTYHIARTGHDANIEGPYKNNKPTTIPVSIADRIPGAPLESKNLFDISQILAWLAKERHDVQEQLEWREQITELLKPLSKE